MADEDKEFIELTARLLDVEQDGTMVLQVLDAQGREIPDPTRVHKDGHTRVALDDAELPYWKDRDPKIANAGRRARKQLEALLKTWTGRRPLVFYATKRRDSSGVMVYDIDRHGRIYGDIVVKGAVPNKVIAGGDPQDWSLRDTMVSQGFAWRRSSSRR